MTPEFGVQIDLTDALIQKFTQDNSLKVKDRRSADSIIEGKIRSIRDQATSYDRSESVSEIKIYITVHIKFEDIKKNKVMWEEDITQWGTYDPSGSDGQTREEAIQEAIDKIVDDVFNKTVTGW